MPNRVSAALALALLAATSLAGCEQTGTAGRSDPPSKPWVRSEGKVYEMAFADDAIVALQVNRKKHFELVSLDPETGKVRHRHATELPLDWQSEVTSLQVLAGGFAVAYSEDTIDVLDPATFKPKWGYAGAVTTVRNCKPNVCVVDPFGKTHVLADDNGADLWTTRSTVYWRNALIKVSYAGDARNWTIRGVRPDSGTPKPGWTVHPTKPTAERNGFTFDDLADDAIAVRPLDSDGNVLATRVYDAETGSLRWSRKLDVTYVAGHYIGFDDRHRSVHFLDPKTGEDLWAAKAPRKHVFDADEPIAVDSDNRVWLALHEAGSDDVAFAPTDAENHKLGALDPSRHTVVFSQLPELRPVTVQVDGKTRSMKATRTYRPVDSATGAVVDMPEDLPLPELVSGDHRNAYVVGKDGHAIIPRR